jgi:hypothetical protein
MNDIQCPECGWVGPRDSSQCPQCLLIFEKHNRKVQLEQNQVRASLKLDQSWSDIILDYSNINKHEDFVNMAITEKNLPFASQQYRKMLELNPMDEVAIKMRDKIIQVATLTFTLPQRGQVKQSSKLFRNIFIAFITVIVVVVLMTFLNMKK